MNTKQIKSSFIVRAALLLLTVFTTTGAWAQTPIIVQTEEQLTAAIADGANIQLAKDIQLSNYLNINGVTVTIDLNGHRLSRNLSSSASDGHIFWVHANGNTGGNLTIDDSSDEHSGTIEGGKATNGGGINVWPGCSLTVNGGTFKNNSASDCGGAIFVRNDATVTVNNATFIGNSAGDHAGAIWNNGTFTATDCTFENNTAKDVGGIYNAVSDDGTTAGTATLTNCTFTGNTSTAGAGALANAVGATVMTIEGGTIQNNSADSRGGGIWNGGTLNMKGVVTVTGNTKAGNEASNVFLKTGKVITVTGDLTGSSIGVDLENISGTFTSGWGSKDPSGIFTADLSTDMTVGLEGNEACVTTKNPVYYMERSWDATNKRIISTAKRIIGLKIDAEAIPREGEYKEVTDAPDDWFQIGGYSNSAEYYVVRGNVNRETIVVLGKNVHLILCDEATLTLTGGLKLEDDHKLYIHCMSYGVNMGRLIVTNKYEKAAGIGSALHKGKEKTVGELVIHGGHIEVTGGEYGAGIGSCARIKETTGQKLCNSVTVYGGTVTATGGDNAAGIGGGSGYGGHGIDGGKFILYEGTVIAKGGEYAAGVGGGGSYMPSILTSDARGNGGYGDEVTIYGGELTATGGNNGAGIGSGHFSESSDKNESQCGGTLRIHGGTVTATGGDDAAGIGGGSRCGGANVYVYDGTVLANGGERAAAIGGGLCGKGFVFHISGGTVTAIGGEKASGIGGGEYGDGGDVTINGGTVIAKAGNQGDLGNRAIGPGQNHENYGTLIINDAMMVGAGNNGSVERIYDADERKNACWYRSYAEISPCTHPSGLTYTINEDGTHTSHCKHCTMSETAGHSTGTCICGYNDGSYTITIATSSGTGYEGVGETVNVGNNKPYTLPVCSTFPDGYDFAGWVVNPESQDNGILPNEGETLLQAGENITVTENVSIFARYQALEISLADDGDNGETLYTYNERKAASVTLTGRTLWKDGDWNTLCLPFALDSFEGTPLEGATVMTFDNASFADGTLTLNFTEVTSLEAGQPCIVKWASGENVTNPVFTDVTISDTTAPVETDVVTFKGIYSPYKITEENIKLLFVGANNKVYYPTAALNINAFRAYFELQGDLVCGEASQGANAINNFVLNFEEGKTTGIKTTIFTNFANDNAWYSLDGRRLNGKPTQKGVYINNGKKKVIK